MPLLRSIKGFFFVIVVFGVGCWWRWFFYCCLAIVGYCNYHFHHISNFILIHWYWYLHLWSKQLCGKGPKNSFFPHGHILREKANLHRKCKNRKSENIRHSQNWLSSAVCSSKCKKMLWGGDLFFPAPNMFFCPIFFTPILRDKSQCRHTKTFYILP